MTRDLYMTALRVLSKFACGERQDEKQIAELRRNAMPGEATVSIDELCCRIIHRRFDQPESRLEKST